MVVGPGVARMIAESEENHKLESDITSKKHREDTASFCNSFQTHVFALIKIYFKNTTITSNMVN